MKKTLIALAAVAVSGTAMAQTTISGSVNVGLVNSGAVGAKTQIKIYFVFFNAPRHKL
jgi:hypothetical protein